MGLFSFWEREPRIFSGDFEEIKGAPRGGGGFEK